MFMCKQVNGIQEFTLSYRVNQYIEGKIWLSVGNTDNGPRINVAATGDITAETARRLANLLRVAADVAEEEQDENQNRIRQQLKQQ